MDNRNKSESILEEAAKVIVLFVVIIGLIIACVALYLNSFMNRIRKYEMENASATTTIETADGYSWGEN